MYVVLKSTHVDHSDYVRGSKIHVRRDEDTYVDTKKAILPKKKSSRRIEVFHLILRRIHTLLYSSDRYRVGSEHVAIRIRPITRETVDESPREEVPAHATPRYPKRF